MSTSSPAFNGTEPDSITLYRAIGPGQLRCIIQTGWRKFPPRWSSQRYFYPMIHPEFAHQIASQWHVQNSGVGYVVRFRVEKGFLEPYPVYVVGGPEHKEYRIAADELDEMNDHMVGNIELIAVYHSQGRGRLLSSDACPDTVLA